MTAESHRLIEGRTGAGKQVTRGILIVADHASAYVPEDVDLGIAADVLSRHVAIDIGVAPLAEALCGVVGAGAILAGVSRLVCDFNRDEDAAGILPIESDGILILGNRLDDLGREARLARFFRPWHTAIAAAIDQRQPAMLLSLHSFTPSLATRPEEQRPWEIGVLYNQDDRAARIAIPLLAAAGIITGDNQPYSGRILNATMNRHAEARGLPYLGLEVRQDLIGNAADVERWAARLAPVIVAVRDVLTSREFPEAHDAGAFLP